ncbi:methionyl-tRNA formyltransferase [Aeromonas hydrophila]|uniref:methionyl-tRNA formyltransferase n=1 Tax=Aeromonas hydrophila TaxID=644 RepID=UPI00188F90B1|nr:methionyl-tRNA formyltransferase [Aeromonas hydrophila]MBF4800254.1 methionyl-tRNA formyltransferase [Aeromonas hydrophila]
MSTNNEQGFKQIMPADGWYFRHETAQQNGTFVMYPLAAWALTYDGNVIGLIAANFQDQQPQRLFGVPPVPGMYKHADELTPAEKNYLMNIKLSSAFAD